RQAPLLTIFLGGEVVVSSKVALERFELLTVLKTYDVVGRHGLAHGNGRLFFFSRSDRFFAAQRLECGMNISNQPGEVCRADGVVAYIGRNDICTVFDKVKLDPVLGMSRSGHRRSLLSREGYLEGRTVPGAYVLDHLLLFHQFC